MPNSLPLDHIGIAVTDLEKAITLYTHNFGHTLTHREELLNEGIAVAFLETGASTIELISPITQNGPVYRFISSRGEGMHHLCLRSKNIEADLARLIDAGFKAIDTKPRTGARGKKIAFLHPSSVGGVLLELCQEK